jgi:eukaryotic-like serine/threonine-protein kinase
VTVGPGSRLGPYEIVAPLGSGGMGEVYRARDTRLGRDVAIKVLPANLSESAEVRARFEREARTISSLNHPNICTLHDVGHEDGTAYLVMELVEGETLAARLTKGALPTADVLRIGIQIADALERAHRAGVIHRDLKPGNIMLTRSGAKLMDFGLSRASGLAGPGGTSGLSGAMTQSPTVAAPLTAEGTIIGTFQYMAPEQLEGREADERCDIWALGCVLYEMATGRRAFEGRSQASLITSIMGSEPPPVSQLAPLAPPGLDRLVRNCLTKDPDERTRTAHDVKLQLVGLQEGTSVSGVAATPVMARPARGARLPWLIAAAAVIAAAAMALMLATRDRGPRGPIHVTIEPATHQVLVPYASGVSISPDGHALVYAAVDSSGTYNVWVRRFDSPDAKMLMNIPGIGGGLIWSPDSRAIAVMGNSLRKLVVVPVDGGAANEVCPVNGPRGAAWSRRGVIVLAPTPQGPLYRVPASGGEPVQVTWLDSTRHESGHRFPCFLPDGEHFLFVSMPPSGPEGFDIYAGSLGSRAVKKIMTAESAVTYAAPGYLLYRREGKLMAQRFDPERLELQGHPISLAEAPPLTDITAEPVATASEDGRLVVLDESPPDTRLAWLDRGGAVRQTLALPPGPWGPPALSPDDHYAAVTNGDDLWRIDLARSVPLRLTSGGGYHNTPVWSPDGRMIAYTAGGKGREEINVLSSDGSGEPHVVPTTDDLFKLPTQWTNDGIVVTIIRGPTTRDVLLAPYPRGSLIPLVETPFSEFAGKVSPDGRWLAYLSTEAGVPPDVYVQSYPTPGHKVRVSSSGADDVWWIPGGDELCYRNSSRTQMMSVHLSRVGEDIHVGEPGVLFRFPPGVQGTSFAHDGQRMLVSLSSEGGARRSAHVIFDWTALLPR